MADNLRYGCFQRLKLRVALNGNESIDERGPRVHAFRWRNPVTGISDRNHGLDSGLAYPDGSLMSNPITATAAVRDQTESARLRPKLMSFDVFGTLISVRESSYGAFERILLDAGAPHLDVRSFWEYWEHRNIAHHGLSRD